MIAFHWDKISHMYIHVHVHFSADVILFVASIILQIMISTPKTLTIARAQENISGKATYASIDVSIASPACLISQKPEIILLFEPSFDLQSISTLTPGPR